MNFLEGVDVLLFLVDDFFLDALVEGGVEGFNLFFDEPRPAAAAFGTALSFLEEEVVLIFSFFFEALTELPLDTFFANWF